MKCLVVNPKFHIHLHRPAKRIGFHNVKATFKELHEWVYLGKRVTIRWSNHGRLPHRKELG